jgi:hypothetical protein
LVRINRLWVGAGRTIPFPKVNFITVRLSTDRPETVFEAFGNILPPPINPEWIVEIVRLANLVKVPFLSKGINAWGFGKKMIRTLGFSDFSQTAGTASLNSNRYFN